MTKKKKSVAEKQYESHWFVESLRYKKPSLPRIRRHKSTDPKQKVLFDKSCDGSDV